MTQSQYSIGEVWSKVTKPEKKCPKLIKAEKTFQGTQETSKLELIRQAFHFIKAHVWIGKPKYKI